MDSHGDGQDTFGGSSSNYTKRRVLDESTLVEIYRRCRENVEQNLHLNGLTTRHAPPDLTKTYMRMKDYLTTHGPNEFRPGRKTAYSIPDMIDRGQAQLEKAADGLSTIDEEEGLKGAIEEEDIISEL
jgi:hypothetical protein